MLQKYVYLSRKTILEMLSDRKYNTYDVVRFFAYTEFTKMFAYFDNYSGIFDIIVSNQFGHKTYVKFVKTINDKIFHSRSILESKESISVTKVLDSLKNFIIQTNDLNNNDTIIFIICYGDNIHEIHTTYESNNTNIQVFHVTQLIYNVTKHILVPKHEILTLTEIAFIKKKLYLSSLSQLPVIKNTDPVARYLNMKDGDICRIYRPSKTTATHICYRICISDNYSQKNLINTNTTISNIITNSMKSMKSISFKKKIPKQVIDEDIGKMEWHGMFGGSISYHGKEKDQLISAIQKYIRRYHALTA